MTVKRLWEPKSTFKTYSAKLSPQQPKKNEDMCTEPGSSKLKEETVQVCFYFPADIPFADLGTVSRTTFAVLEPPPSGESVRVGEM